MGGAASDDLLFLYEDSVVFGIPFKLAIKTAQDGNELWLKTFHKIDPAKVRARLRQMTIIRPHKQ